MAIAPMLVMRFVSWLLGINVHMLKLPPPPHSPATASGCRGIQIHEIYLVSGSNGFYQEGKTTCNKERVPIPDSQGYLEENAVGGFRKVGIYPYNKDAVPPSSLHFSKPFYPPPTSPSSPLSVASSGSSISESPA